MHTVIDTDGAIEGREALAVHLRGLLESSFGRFGDRVTAVEVH